MDKLNILRNMCKCSVQVTINPHRDFYQTVEGYLAEEDGIDEAIYDGMIITDTIIEVTFYPDSPVGSYTVYHLNIERALDEAISILKNREG